MSIFIEYFIKFVLNDGTDMAADLIGIILVYVYKELLFTQAVHITNVILSLEILKSYLRSDNWHGSDV